GRGLPSGCQEILEPDVAGPQNGTVALLLLLEQPKKQAEMRGQVLRDIRYDYPRHRRTPALLHPLELVVAQWHDGDRLGPTISQLVFQLALRIEWVGGDDNAAGLEDAVERHDGLGRVGHVDDRPVTFGKAVRGEPGGDGITGLVQLAKGDPPSLEND